MTDSKDNRGLFWVRAFLVAVGSSFVLILGLLIYTLITSIILHPTGGGPQAAEAPSVNTAEACTEACKPFVSKLIDNGCYCLAEDGSYAPKETTP